MELLSRLPHGASRRWLRWLAGALGLAVLGLAAGLLLPDRARITRSITLRAPPEAVFERVANLHRWPEWTAWTTNRFPDLVYRFDGPAQGVGATLIAAGKSSGDGTVRIIRAVPEAGVDYTLDFNHGTQEFDGTLHYASVSDGLRLTWTLEARLGGNPLKRWAGLAMETLMAEDMETGLARLKAQVEAQR